MTKTENEGGRIAEQTMYRSMMPGQIVRVLRLSTIGLPIREANSRPRPLASLDGR